MSNYFGVIFALDNWAVFHVRLLGCAFHCYNWLQHCPLHDFVKLDFTGWVKRKTGERYSYVLHSQTDTYFYFNMWKCSILTQSSLFCSGFSPNSRNLTASDMHGCLRWGTASDGGLGGGGGGRDGIARGELSLEARLANSIWGNGSAPTVSFDLEKTEWKRWKQVPKRQTLSHIFTFLQYRIILGPTKHVLHFGPGLSWAYLQLYWESFKPLKFWAHFSLGPSVKSCFFSLSVQWWCIFQNRLGKQISENICLTPPFNSGNK